MRDYVADSWEPERPDALRPLRLRLRRRRGPPSSTNTTPTRRPASTRARAFQWIWLEDRIAAGALPADADQFNSLHEKLEARFRALFPSGGFVHFASDPDFVEDRQTVRFLEDLAKQAGLEPKFVAIGDIGLDADGRFVDEDN